MKIPEMNPLTACLIAAAHGAASWILARFAFETDVKSATILAIGMAIIMFAALIMKDEKDGFDVD